MEITEKIIDQVAVLTLKGSVVAEPTIHEIRDMIHALIGRERKFVILNMEEVTYMNSMGLGMLVAALTTLRRIGGDLKLVCLTANVKNSFVITQLTQVFQIFETEKEALASFNQAG